jgi:hypothetical protein
MTGLLITIDLNGAVRSNVIAASEGEERASAWLVSLVEPEIKRIRGLVRDALAERDSPTSRAA